MSVDEDYIAKLEARNDELEEQVRQLKEILGLTIEVPLVFGLTSHEAQLFGLLLKRDIVTKEMGLTLLYGNRPDGDTPEIKIIDVYICKLRAKIEAFGIKVETVWGRGYRMSAEAKAKANSYLETPVVEQV